jgi:imidazolonepropionase-like amidohydrolase
MKRTHVIRLLAPALSAALALVLATSPAAQSTAIAIVGGTVYPASGERIERATVLIRDGRIEAVGANVAVPPDAERVDAAGRWVTPGLINVVSQLGIVEIPLSAGPTDERANGQNAIAAAFRPWESFNAASPLLAATRNDGITTIGIFPAGNLISGQHALVDLGVGPTEAMLRRAPSAVAAQAQHAPSAGTRDDNAALLRRAGVTVILVSDSYGDGTHFNTRNIRFEAGNAVANGMSWDDALRAVTVAPAEVFGVADRVGTLRPGLDANVVVWTGDPFEFDTRAEVVFVRGVRVDAPSRQDELMERYRTLPPSYR